MEILRYIVAIIVAYSSGIVVAGGIFAFIAVIGVVPRLAQRTGTTKYIPFYEDAIMLGGILGTLTMYIDFYIPIGSILVAFFSFAIGIFIGCLAVSLAEVFNVVPIFTRRLKVTRGIPVFILALALGKSLGSLLYFFYMNFIN